LGPIEWVLPEDGDIIQSPKRRVLKYKQDGVLDKNRTMDNVQNHNICNTSYYLIMLLNLTLISHSCLQPIVLTDVMSLMHNWEGGGGVFKTLFVAAIYAVEYAIIAPIDVDRTDFE
jgi:hypothetical protein